MMWAVSQNSVTRSSLEVMLESLQQREENETAEGNPPALPPRPKLNYRTRPPSTKRWLPMSLEVCASKTAQGPLKKGEENGFRAKKVKGTKPGASPVGPESNGEKRMSLEEKEMGHKDKDEAKLENLPHRSDRRFEESERDGGVGNKKPDVWCRGENCTWRQGQIQSTSGEKSLVLLSDGSVVAVPRLEILRANPEILEGVDNLVQLSCLDEPSVLHNLQQRYSRDIIYTKAGPVLIAVNPLKDVDLYGDDLVAYRKQLFNSPHVYAVVETAYKEMMTGKNMQSIIISGESGSGKTETAKKALEYLSAIGGAGNGIEFKVLQTSCILEAFGNAKTSRNDNASRFGKLVEIHFSAEGQICGAKVRTFLVEKSRVVHLAQGERSYHIFYQLCAGAPSGLRGRLRIKTASDYKYLSQGGCMEIPNIDDTQTFHMLMRALDTLQISKEDQEHAFGLLSAVLWIGNISFLVVDEQNHTEVVTNEAVNNAASLMGCSEHDLILALSTRKVKAGKDDITRRLTLQQAIDRRDALAELIYTSLFDWLVENINLSLAMGKCGTERSICILDSCGFEVSEMNGFEQFCINYTNERLQQHFCQHLFKLEQEEYERDGIDWIKLDFKDNQDCLDLFEKKPVSLISVLDEVSSFPKAKGSTLTSKFRQHLGANHCFVGERETFSVRHCAGEVVYDIAEFLDKNRDPLHSEFIQLLSSCTRRLPQYLSSCLLKQSLVLGSASLQPEISDCQKQSFVSKLQGQLFKLFQHLDNTKPHYICCIRPNSKRIPGVLEKDLTLKQLKCCSIQEILRNSRCRYPTRVTHQEFTKRYAFLLPKNMSSRDPLSMSVAVLQQFGILPEMYQVGYTKLYFRVGQIDVLENARDKALEGTLEVQKGHHARCNFHELKKVITTLQSWAGYTSLCLRLLTSSALLLDRNNIHRTNMVAKIFLSDVRGEIARKEYRTLLQPKKQDTHEALDENLMAAVVHIQSVIRACLVRKHFATLKKSTQFGDTKPKPGRRISELEDLPAQTPVVEELQQRVLMAEATLREKEKENTALREQVEQFEARWPQYEAKMKSMEEMWQKQMASLEMSLAAAKKNLDAVHSTGPPRRLNGAQSPHSYDSEDTSMGSMTPVCGTPTRNIDSSMDDVPCRENNVSLNPIIPLVKEFEQRRQHFDREVQAIVELKSEGRLPSANPVEEVRILRCRFEAWKRDYRSRLREAKAKAHRFVYPEAEKHRWKWWGLRSKRSS